MLNFKNISTIFVLSIVLVSCGTYQTVSNDDDGIYDIEDNSGKEIVVNKENKTTTVTSETKNNDKSIKYQNYFKNKAEKIKIENDEIFTDVDSYTSANTDEELLDKDVRDFSINNPSWEESGETEISIYNYNTFRPYCFGYFPYNHPFHSGIYISLNPWWFSGFDYCNYSPAFYYADPFYYYFLGYYSGFYPSYFYSPYYFTPYRYNNYRYSKRNTSRLYASTNRRSIRRSFNNQMVRNIRSASIRNTRTHSVRNSNSPRTRTSTPSVRTSSPRVRTSTPRVRTSSPRRSSTTRSNRSIRRSSSYSSSFPSSSSSSRGSSFSNSSRSSSRRR